MPCRARLCGFGILLAGYLLYAVRADAFSVTVDAPTAVKPLLMQHVYLFREQQLPERRADRFGMMRRTRLQINDLLATEGYFTPEVTFDRSEEVWHVTVTPGPRTTISEVDITFDGEIAGQGDEEIVRAANLKKNWKLKKDMPFRQKDWDNAKATLLDEVSGYRYAAARIVRSRAEIDSEAATARLSILIDSGPTFYLGPLNVTGRKDLPESFVFNYSHLKVGEVYDRDELFTFQRNLQNTPQLGSVIVDIERDPALAAAVPVDVQIVEALPKRVNFGVGVSSDTGYRVQGGYRNVNLMKKAWEWSSAVRMEQKRQSAFSDLFFERDKDGYQNSIGALIEQSDIEDLDQRIYAIGAARSSTRGNIDSKLTLRLQHEILEPKGGERTSTNALTLNWKWTQHAVDNLFDPRNGYVVETQIGGGTDIGIGSQNFVRVLGRFIYYMPVGQRDNLILRAEAGKTFAPSRDGIPQDFLFRVGGSQSVRGYSYNSLGVKDGKATVGGRYMGIVSAEYVHWFEDSDFGMAFFVDSGDAADTRSDFLWHTGVGSGVRWRSPAGPLAVDLAWGNRSRQVKLHFGLGIAF